MPTARSTGLPWGVDVYSFPVGTKLVESELTSFDSLAALIDKVNAELFRQGCSERVDRSLVELRDALAHGRISANAENETSRLLKFNKPNSGRVQITFNQVMSKEWFAEQQKRVFSSIQIVAKFFEEKIELTKLGDANPSDSHVT
jgi:hypothetical protein